MYVQVLCILFLLRLRFPANQPLSSTILRRYGHPVLLVFRKCEKLCIRVNKLKCDLEFLEICKAYEAIPRFLRFKLYKKNLYDSKLYKSWQFKLLDLEIKNKIKSIGRAEREYDDILRSLSSVVSWLDCVCLKQKIANNSSKAIDKAKKVHGKKHFDLGLPEKFSVIDPDKVVTNVSSRQLTKDEKFALQFGLEFCLPVNKPNFFRYFLAFEKLYKFLSSLNPYNPECSDFNLKASLQNIAYRWNSNNNHVNRLYNPLSKQHILALRNLSKDETITISRPDKGRGVVILNRNDYINKVQTILSDNSKFQHVSDDPFVLSLKLEDKLNRFLRKLKSQNILDQSTYDSLLISGSSPGTLYGLPKVHKGNIPVRPILSACCTHSFNLAKFFVPILSAYTIDEYTTKNSYEFVSSLQSIPHIDSKFLCSYDVESLFTNVPLREVIDICVDLVFQNSSHINGLDRVNFKKLLEFALLDTYFFFDGKLYKQIDGVAMGSPLGPTLANIFLCFHEKQWLSRTPSHFAPMTYKRYVDDIFTVFDNENQANQFLSYINSQHSNLNFTLEKESSNKLAFLDVMMRKNERNIETSVYRKPTTTELGTNYFSFTPIKFKLNAIKTLIHRAYSVCSNYKCFDSEIVFLRKFFTYNAYPIKFFEKEVFEYLNKQYKPSITFHTVPKLIQYLVLPFSGYSSHKLEKEIRELVLKYYPQLNLRLIFTNMSSIGRYFKHK